MITQSLEAATQATDERGSGRSPNWTTTDPRKNRAFNRAGTVSPDEAYNAGYRDGFNRRGMLGSMDGNAHYSAGFGAGHNAMRLTNP
jgi:hypothetical protein